MPRPARPDAPRSPDVSIDGRPARPSMPPSDCRMDGTRLRHGRGRAALPRMTGLFERDGAAVARLLPLLPRAGWCCRHPLGRRFQLSKRSGEDEANLRASWERLGRNSPSRCFHDAVGEFGATHTGGTPWPVGSAEYPDGSAPSRASPTRRRCEPRDGGAMRAPNGHCSVARAAVTSGARFAGSTGRRVAAGRPSHARAARRQPGKGDLFQRLLGRLPKGRRAARCGARRRAASTARAMRRARR